MSTMEQQDYRQQATMSTAHHTNDQHYGQRRASSNLVDQTVTQTARDYAHTQGQDVSSAPNTRYAPYHRDIYTAAPIFYTPGTAMYEAIINHPLWSGTLWTESIHHTISIVGTTYQLPMKLHHQTDMLAVI